METQFLDNAIQELHRALRTLNLKQDILTEQCDHLHIRLANLERNFLESAGGVNGIFVPDRIEVLRKPDSNCKWSRKERHPFQSMVRYQDRPPFSISCDTETMEDMSDTEDEPGDWADLYTPLGRRPSDCMLDQAVTNFDDFALAAFTEEFDRHFDVNSQRIKQVLSCGCCGHDPEHDAVLRPFPSLKARPEAWGIKVQFLAIFLRYISDDLCGYTAGHALDSSFRHVCLASPCQWHHGGTIPYSRVEASEPLQFMRPNMHVVVQRYIKAWTYRLDAGMALALNAGHLAQKLQMTYEPFCLATVFISHSWSGHFSDFVASIRHRLAPDDVVWVCSFALFQHGDIEGSLRSVQECPFALAIQTVPRVLAITDKTAEAFERCWVVLEAHLAQKWRKQYDIALPDDANTCLWESVWSKLQTLDAEMCKATRERDKHAILEYARQAPGGTNALNIMVRTVASEALKRSEIHALIVTGNVVRLKEIDQNRIESWRSPQGGNVLHIAAEYDRAEVMCELIPRTTCIQRDLLDSYHRTPLSVAVAHENFSAVVALIKHKVNIDATFSDVGTPLHYAAMNGNSAITLALLEAKANPEASCNYKGRLGFHPLVIASFEGHADVVKLLLEWRAGYARTTNGSTALIYAAQEGRTDVCRILISSGLWDVNDRCDNSGGRTSLFTACKNGRTDTVELLLEAQASSTMLDHAGRGVYQYCMECAERFPSIAQQLTLLLAGHY